MITHHLTDDEADQMLLQRGTAIPVRPLSSVDMFKTIEKPIRLSMGSLQVEEIRRLFENSHRRCLLIFDSAGPIMEEGSREVTIRLEPI